MRVVDQRFGEAAPFGDPVRVRPGHRLAAEPAEEMPQLFHIDEGVDLRLGVDALLVVTVRHRVDGRGIRAGEMVMVYDCHLPG